MVRKKRPKVTTGGFAEALAEEGILYVEMSDRELRDEQACVLQDRRLVAAPSVAAFCDAQLLVIGLELQRRRRIMDRSTDTAPAVVQPRRARKTGGAVVSRKGRRG